MTGLDWLITVVDPNTAAIKMAEEIKNLVQQIKAGATPSTDHLESAEAVKEAKRAFKEGRIKRSFALLNKITDEEMEASVRETLREKNVTPIGAIRNNPAVTRSWLEGKPLEIKTAKREIKEAIETLEELNSSQRT